MYLEYVQCFGELTDLVLARPGLQENALVIWVEVVYVGGSSQGKSGYNGPNQNLAPIGPNFIKCHFSFDSASHNSALLPSLMTTPHGNW